MQPQQPQQTRPQAYRPNPPNPVGLGRPMPPQAPQPMNPRPPMAVPPPATDLSYGGGGQRPMMPPQPNGPLPGPQQVAPPGTHRPSTPPDVEGTPTGMAPQPHGGRRRLYPSQQQQQQPAAPLSAGFPPPPPQQQQSGPIAPQPPQFFTPAGQNGPIGQTTTMAPSHVQHVTQQMANMGIQKGHAANPVGVPLIGVRPNAIELDRPSDSPLSSLRFAVVQHPTAVASPLFGRCTLQAIPDSYSLLSKSRIPFGLLLDPYRMLLPGEEVPVIGATSRADPGFPCYSAEEIVRCRSCRTYINPYVTFVDQGHWRCNMCFLINDVPPFFDYDVNTQQYIDRYTRPELTHSVVEYIAPTEYMVRAPQPPVFVFVVDVSQAAVASGMLETFASTLRHILDSLRNEDQRLRIGFITFDHVLHFYNLESSLMEPQMMVVSDLDDIYLPTPEDLLVNLVDSRTVVETLLEKMGSLFRDTTSAGNAMGPAMEAAYKLISPVGGNLVVLSASLPTIGMGALKPREDVKAYGTSAENNLLQPVAGFIKSFAVNCSRAQVAVDMFLFGTQYLDLATLICPSRFTGGSVYFYPGFNAARSEDAIKFGSEFNHFLTRPNGLEAVFRVRASKGIRSESFHGSFFVRSSDLLALSTVSPDNSYALQLTIEENLTSSFVCFQSALLYTADYGERRIRIVTIALPVTSDLGEVYRSIDQFALCTLMAKMAVERALTSKLEDAREALINKCVDLLGVYKTNFAFAGSNPQLLVCENIKFLPLLVLGLLKSRALRGGSQTPLDFRSFAIHLFRVLPTTLCRLYIHPNLYELHTIPPEVGLPAEPSSPTSSAGEIMMPLPINLTSELLVAHGFYLLDTCDALFLWVGRAVHPQLVADVFDRPSYDALQSGKTTLPIMENDFSRRVQNIIGKIRERLNRRNMYPQLFLVKEEGGDPLLKLMFLSYLIEDRHDYAPSYHQFLNDLKERVNKGSF